MSSSANLRYEFVKADGSESVVLTEKEITSHNPILTHTGKADLRATIEPHRELEAYAQRQDRLNVYFGGSCKWTGYLTDIGHNKGGGSGSLSADGIAKRLEETRPDYESLGGPLSYSQTALADAIEDYWGRTPFDTVSVTPGSAESVAANSQIQSADSDMEWQTVLGLEDSDPLEVTGGGVSLAQSCFTVEAEDYTQGTATLIGGRAGFSGGNGAGVAFTSLGEFTEYEFSLDYTIPSEAFGVFFRWGKGADTGASDRLEFSLDGTAIGEFSIAGSTGPAWQELSESPTWNPPGDVSSGSHTLRIEHIENNSDSPQLDVVAPVDTRYNYTLDNSTDANNFLSGPELYPDAASITLQATTTSYNISAATVTTTWTDTSNNQALAVSNNAGSSFKTGSNTQTLDVSFSDVGRTAQTKLTFGRYGTQSSTPTTGVNGQRVTSYTLDVDLDSTVVIDKLELSRNHFDNLKTLHEYGDFVWVVEHDDKDIADLQVRSFPRGAVTRDAPPEFDTQKNQAPEIQSGAYYNSIYLEGAKDANGDRPSAEVKDTDAIAADRGEISPGVLRDLNITTESGAVFRAQALLNAARSNNDLLGTITVPPVITDPGYAYPVDFGDGEQYKTAEEVRLTQSEDTHEAVFDFVSRKGLSEEITSLKRNARDIGNQV